MIVRGYCDWSLWLAVWCLCSTLGGTVSAGEVERLLEGYEKIKRVSCSVRRVVDGEAGEVRFLSRVYYCSDDRLHVQNFSPVPRRIVCDGKTFFSYAEGDPKGFSAPVSELSEKMLVSLRKVPGTAMEHLLRLRGVEATTLEPTDGVSKRLGYNVDGLYVVLGLDALGRPAALDMYQTAKMENLRASYRYRQFSEVAEGVHVPFEHEATLYMDGKAYARETVKLDAYKANRPLAVSLFKPASFFAKDVAFVNSFELIHQ
jgi:hypothetical protein